MKRIPIAVCLLAIPCLAQSNWPQFRGEGGLGIGSGAPPVEFSPDTKVRWKVELPHGHYTIEQPLSLGFLSCFRHDLCLHCAPL
jgi:hypothetical protein